MGKRPAIVLAVLALAVLGAGFIAAWPRIREEWFIARLESKDEAIRKEAAERLGEMRSVRAIPGLVQALKRERRGVIYVDVMLQYTVSPQDGGPAAHALARIGVPSLPALLEASQGPSPQKENAFLAIFLMGDEGFGALQSFRSDPKLGGAADAAFHLINFGSRYDSDATWLPPISEAYRQVERMRKDGRDRADQKLVPEASSIAPHRE